MNLRALASGISVLALALAAAGCAKYDTSTTTESGITLFKDGTLTICTHLPYEPFEFTEGGEVVGFDPDVLKAFLASMDEIQSVRSLLTS